MITATDWSKYAPYFKESEFTCKHTGRCIMDVGTMDKLLAMRIRYGKPMTISSGYRDPSHPIEAKKDKPGVHSTGHAFDVAVRGSDAVTLLAMALEYGFTGIGVQQKGEGRFMHFDDYTGPLFPRKMIWSY
jgi:uncharacterized protein YcbK (DUF882 family)